MVEYNWGEENVCYFIYDDNSEVMIFGHKIDIKVICLLNLYNYN